MRLPSAIHINYRCLSAVTPPSHPPHPTTPAHRPGYHEDINHISIVLKYTHPRAFRFSRLPFPTIFSPYPSSIHTNWASTPRTRKRNAYAARVPVFRRDKTVERASSPYIDQVRPMVCTATRMSVFMCVRLPRSLDNIDTVANVLGRRQTASIDRWPTSPRRAATVPRIACRQRPRTPLSTVCILVFVRPHRGRSSNCTRPTRG